MPRQLAGPARAAWRALVVLVACGLGGCAAQPGAGPRGAAARGLRLVGYTDLGGRPASHMVVHEAGGQWYLYVGHAWHSGWSVIDVTDPAAPRLVRFVAGPANTDTRQMELADTRMITPLERVRDDRGGRPDDQFEAGFRIWDVSDPENPRLAGQYRAAGDGTHRAFYAGGRYVHCASAVDGFDGRIYQIIDIADPVRPVEVGRWWVPGQHVARGERPERAGISLDGMPYVDGNLAYLPYGTAGLVVVDISDVTLPHKVGGVRFSPPFADDAGVGTVLPMSDRRVAFTTSGSVAEFCREPSTQAALLDISDAARPVVLSFLPRPQPPPDAAYGDFCDKGGRFGPLAVNLHQHNSDVQPQADLLFVTYLNAGLRVFDIGNPRRPRETGYFLPPDPDVRVGPLPRTRLVAQAEDVVIDRRGYIYVSEENQGVWVLRYVGAAS